MRQTARTGPVALFALLFLAVAGPAAATVDFFGSATLEHSATKPGCSGIAFNPSDTYPLFRGRTHILTVVGFAVDNAKEVQLSSLPGVSALINRRVHGPGSSLEIMLTVELNAPLGNGEIRLRYDVELAGFDRVLARVVEIPHVTSFSVEPAPGVSESGPALPSSPAYALVPGNLYTLVLTGKNLLDVRPKAPFASQGRFTDVSVLSASDAELKVRLKPVLLGSATLDRTHFQFEKLRCVEPPVGTASIRLSIAVPPTPTPTGHKSMLPKN
ncbi:MAG: hypothetical protein NEA02_04110 [Thermoanaerobaculia bacterium]|nr:hypothetical protein [Thermoanaerobaculia bacterium]